MFPDRDLVAPRRPERQPLACPLVSSGAKGSTAELSSGPHDQDARDAIGAAVTARLYDHGETERFGDIVVPLSPNRRRTFRP